MDMLSKNLYLIYYKNIGGKSKTECNSFEHKKSSKYFSNSETN